MRQERVQQWLGFACDYREKIGVNASTPEEQAYPLVFLCSDAANAITGITLTSDQKYFSSGITNSFPPGKGTADYLSGRYSLLVHLAEVGWCDPSGVGDRRARDDHHRRNLE